MSEDAQPIDPNRLTIEQLAKLLSAAYRERIDIDQLSADVQAGAPVNDDGTFNLVHYSAWQAREMGRIN